MVMEYRGDASSAASAAEGCPVAHSSAPDPGASATNVEVADALDRVADLLEAHGDGPFRVRAYRTAAESVRASTEPLSALLAAEGLPGLEKLPGVGKSIASAISEVIETGRLGMLERLQGRAAPEDLFSLVPGIGEELAQRIHRALGVETLEDLEVAANDGRLARVPGFGPRRVRAVRELLASMLGRSARLRGRRQREHEAGGSTSSRPGVAALLDVDAEYRRRAAAGDLRRIAPRRFNPGHEAWLPIMHAERDGWAFTALFSNTALAHELGMTQDWVVLYCERDGAEDQCTVVTERHGPLSGRRVVRGRERECGEILAGATA
jgi:DNA polymerase (family 10)